MATPGQKHDGLCFIFNSLFFTSFFPSVKTLLFSLAFLATLSASSYNIDSTVSLASLQLRVDTGNFAHIAVGANAIQQELISRSQRPTPHSWQRLTVKADIPAKATMICLEEDKETHLFHSK